MQDNTRGHRICRRGIPDNITVTRNGWIIVVHILVMQFVTNVFFQYRINRSRCMFSPNFSWSFSCIWNYNEATDVSVIASFQTPRTASSISVSTITVNPQILCMYAQIIHVPQLSAYLINMYHVCFNHIFLMFEQNDLKQNTLCCRMSSWHMGRQVSRTMSLSSEQGYMSPRQRQMFIWMCIWLSWYRLQLRWESTLWLLLTWLVWLLFLDTVFLRSWTKVEYSHYTCFPELRRNTNECNSKFFQTIWGIVSFNIWQKM